MLRKNVLNVFFGSYLFIYVLSFTDMRNFYQYQIKLVNDFVSDANLNEHDSDMLVKSILLNSFGSLLMRFRTPFNCFMVDKYVHYCQQYFCVSFYFFLICIDFLLLIVF